MEHEPALHQDGDHIWVESNMYGHGPWGQMGFAWILALPITNCVNLGKIFHLFQTPFLICKMRIIRVIFTESWCEN